MSYFGCSSVVNVITANIELYDDLSAQVNGINKVFTVTRGNYVASKLNVFLARVPQTKSPAIPPDVASYSETDPATGTFTFVDAPLVADLPLLASYEYAGAMT